MNPRRRHAWTTSLLRFVALLLATAMLPSQCRAVAFISSFPDPNGDFRLFTDLANEPDSIFSWDGSVITYKLDASIYQAFPLAKQREQIRLGLSEWSEAHNRPRGTNFDYTRQSNDNSYFDLRGIVTHELGHVLGSQHVNIAWDRDQRNYVPDGGGWIPQQDAGTEVMHDTVARGEIRRVLTHDELDMHDHAYNRTVTFQEVFGNTPADLNIMTCDGCLGHGGVEESHERVNGQPASGREITEGVFYIGDGQYNGTPIGFKTLKQSWEFENDFFPQGVHEVLIRTRGTDNPTPTSQSNHNLGQFSLFDTVYVPDLGILNFEDMAHRWFNPNNGDTVPLGETIKLALQQDVPDWFVLSAAAQDVDDNAVAVGLVTIPPWQNSLLNPDDDQEGDDLGISGKTVTAKGFRIVGPDDLTTTISEVSFAPIADLNISRLEDLSSATLEELRTLGRLETVLLSSPITIGPGDDFVFVLDGERSDLPADLLGQGNFQLLDRPDLADEELFVFADTGSVRTFSVINSGVFVPEPSAIVAMLMGCATFFWLGRRCKG